MLMMTMILDDSRWWWILPYGWWWIFACPKQRWMNLSFPGSTKFSDASYLDNARKEHICLVTKHVQPDAKPCHSAMAKKWCNKKMTNAGRTKTRRALSVNRPPVFAITRSGVTLRAQLRRGVLSPPLEIPSKRHSIWAQSQSNKKIAQS